MPEHNLLQAWTAALRWRLQLARDAPVFVGPSYFLILTYLVPLLPSCLGRDTWSAVLDPREERTDLSLELFVLVLRLMTL